MKNQDSKDESLFKKKGFYVALYSCIGIVMIAAAAISFGNLGSSPEPQKTADKSAVDFSKLEQTNANANAGEKNYLLPTPAPTAGSTRNNYLTPDDRAKNNLLPSNPNAKNSLSPNVTTAPNRNTTVTTAGALRSTGTTGAAVTTKPASGATANTTTGAAVTTTGTSATETPTTGTPATGTPATGTTRTSTPATLTPVVPRVKGVTTTQPSTTTSGGATVPKATSAKDDLVQPIFNYYSEDSKMEWPVLGEIVMDFNITHAIYDKTLDQYRTNDELCIAAPAGTPVKASYAGVVQSVDKTHQEGTRIVIDNGNGWTTTYGQLLDGVLVQTGDIVKEGQVIAGIGSPSNSQVLLGNHLSFKVTKDNRGVDPKELLVQK